MDEDVPFGGGSFVPAATNEGQPVSPALMVVLALGALFLAVPVIAALLWFYGISRLPRFARPYAQVVRVTSWSGVSPRHSQTPYEYAAELARIVPAAKVPLTTIVQAHVAGIYGGRQLEREAVRELHSARDRALSILFPSLVAVRWRESISDRVGAIAAVGQRA